MGVRVAWTSSLTHRFDELRHKTSQLADSMVKEIGRHIDVIIKAKEHTANCLKGLRTFAETH